jgi:hypothetical protein
MSGVIEAAHLLDDKETSARAYELLSPFAQLPVMASLGVACFGSAQHVLGVAALTVGELDRAVAHFQEAIRANLAITHWPAALASRRRYAQALELRAQPGDTAAAARELATAAEEAARLGIPVPDAVLREAPEPAAVCVRQGREWRIEWRRRTAVVRHSVGMLHLAVLIANPGNEIHAVDLVAGVGALGAGGGGPRVSEQPLLDHAAMLEYRQRLDRLRESIDELETTGERAAAERARTERDWLLAELSGATGVSGRTRRFPDSGERARIAVGKAIRRALTQIGEIDPVISGHLRGTVHTGIRCCYRPD